MDIRAIFLGDARTVPTNYRHVTINQARLDWTNFGFNYKEVVSLAVDEPGADGHAFVTEYAGPSWVVSTAGVWSQAWNADTVRGLADDPVGLIEILEGQGLVECHDWESECEWSHPLLQGLVNTYVPVPDGLDESEFYGCLDCFAGLVDALAWDADALADDLDERIFEPGAHAVDLLATNSYLTRMYTTISAHEMTKDPMFHQNPGLPAVDNANLGNNRSHCDGTWTFRMADGRAIRIPFSTFWPDWAVDMPWAEEIEQAGLTGALMSVVDNSETIDCLIDEWNGGSCDEGDPTDPGEEVPWPEDDGGDEPGSDDTSATDRGCGCDASTPSATLSLLALLGLLGRRRRRR